MGYRNGAQCREIYVKAVCARGRKADEQIHTVPAESLRGTLEEVLGCRISNHRCQASYERDTATVRGEYELQVWVSYEQDSDLLRDRVNYKVEVPLAEIGEGVLSERPEVQVDVVEGPTVVEFGFDKEGNIEIVVSLGFRASVLGESRLFVSTCEPSEDDLGAEDLDDDWDWVEDEETIASSHGSAGN
ncbi:MAG: outer spore coat protein CotE [Thermaerobacterales bacterium]